MAIINLPTSSSWTLPKVSTTANSISVVAASEIASIKAPMITATTTTKVGANIAKL